MTIGTKIRHVLKTVAASSPAMRGVRETERLSRLSDEELARLGIPRNRIALHAFRPYID